MKQKIPLGIDPSPTRGAMVSDLFIFFIFMHIKQIFGMYIRNSSFHMFFIGSRYHQIMEIKLLYGGFLSSNAIFYYFDANICWISL